MWGEKKIETIFFYIASNYHSFASRLRIDLHWVLVFPLCHTKIFTPLTPTHVQCLKCRRPHKPKYRRRLRCVPVDTDTCVFTVYSTHLSLFTLNSPCFYSVLSDLRYHPPFVDRKHTMRSACRAIRATGSRCIKSRNANTASRQTFSLSL